MLRDFAAILVTWGLRSYGGELGMIGLEATLEEHIENLVAVFREVKRVLRKDGCCWVNYGDVMRNKQLLMMPARVALALARPTAGGSALRLHFANGTRCPRVVQTGPLQRMRRCFC